MKLKSLLLGSAAALALSTGAQAADPIVSVVSLDACDAYGLSGLTISSGDACLQISGRVRYNLEWGDYAPALDVTPTSHGMFDIENADESYDYDSRVRAEVTLDARAETDFGQSRAVITLEGEERRRTASLGSSVNFVDNTRFTEAYVQLGDTTVLTAGLVKGGGSLANIGNDVPFNYLGTFISEQVDEGVLWSNGIGRGGHVVQVKSEVGDGISVGVGLERLNHTGDNGTLVGVVEVNQAWGSAHFTALTNQVLEGFENNDWAIHTGATVNFDPVRVRGAVAADSEEYINALLSAEATFDMFTIAGTVEGSNQDELGFGASVGADVTETIALNLGFRYFNEGTLATQVEGRETWQVEGELVAAIAENLEATTHLGYLTGGLLDGDNEGVIYGGVGLEYSPGARTVIGGGAEVYSTGAYKLTFSADRRF